MRRFRLTTQINLIFTLVTVLIGLIFIFIFEYSYSKEAEKINIGQLIQYYERVEEGYENDEFPSSNNKFDNMFNGHVIYEDNKLIEFDSARIIANNAQSIERLVTKIKNRYPLEKVEQINGVVSHDGQLIYYVITFNAFSSPSKDKINEMIIVFTNDAFIKSMGNTANTIVRVVFIILLIIGNIIILMWSRSIADRIGKLEIQIKRLSETNYAKEIVTSGNDEISDLGQTVDNMRKEIARNEKIKQEMLQNLSHDFKTPIAVIKSYAEAISDGISDPKEAEVIIKQAEALNIKVHQLLELNKLAYLKGKENFEEVKIKEIIVNIVNNHKYSNDIKIFLDLDDSTLLGIRDNFYVIFSNIIENGLRYAKSKIVITLKNKTISFYNDGEPISDKYIKEGFKPYEKGSKGQFGLGMSIVQKTANHFNLILKVENVEDGVKFTISPR